MPHQLVEHLRDPVGGFTRLAGSFVRSLLVSDRGQRASRRMEPVGGGDGCSWIPSSLSSTRAPG